MRRASSTCLPRTRSIARRAFGGEMRTYLTVALASTSLPHRGRTLAARVRTERPRRRELAELVSDHRLRHVHGHVLAPVVDRDRVADHLRHDRRAARPGPNDLLV